MLRHAIYSVLTGLWIVLPAEEGASQTNNTDRGNIAAALDQRFTATWQGQQLGSILERLSATQRIDIWIDRRIDLQQTASYEFREATVRQAFQQLTANQDLGYSPLSRVVYLGPKASAREIATLIALAQEEVAQLPDRSAKKWLAEEPTAWPELSEPRALLEGWLNQADLELAAAGLVPHDLWPARKLPALPLVDRVVLLLAGFDLTCEISAEGHTCRVVPIAKPVEIAKRYPFSVHTRRAYQELAKGELTQIIKREGPHLVLRGRWEDHQRFQSLIEIGVKTGPTKGEFPRQKSRKLYSLSLKNQPVGKVIDQIASLAEIQVVWDRDSFPEDSDPRSILVSCEVVEADLKTLLEVILSPTKLRFRLAGNKLLIQPGE